MGTTTHNRRNSIGRAINLARRARSCSPWLAKTALSLLFGCAAAAAPVRFVPGQILIKPKARISEEDFKGILDGHGARQHHAIGRLNVRVVNVAEENANAVLTALRKHPGIEYAERDYIAAAAFVPDDTCVTSGSEWHLARIQAPQAWDATVGTTNVLVAVLDSGVDSSHPDLAGAVLAGYDFVGNDSNVADDFGHGTAVAGAIAAAGNNGLGVAGVAYGCRILPVKVMDASGFASYSCLAQGIRYAVDNGARVINLSIAGSSPSATLQDAVNYAWSNNVVVVAAAGNNGNNAPQYPAACDNVVAVSATEPDDSLAWFSSYGDPVMLSAPGDNIWTTQIDADNPYGAWRGTSFASPIVAGVAALVASANPSLSNSQIVFVLEQTADDVGAAGFDPQFGYGRVNAARAVAMAAPSPGDLTPLSPAIPPTVSIAGPADGAEFPPGTNVTVTVAAAAGTDNASITNVAFYVDSALVACRTAAPFLVSWQPPRAGCFFISAVATDSLGLNATSAPVVVQVYSTDTIAPRVTLTNAPPNGARLASPQVSFAGRLSDNAALPRVEVQVNGDPYQPAAGSTNWSTQIVLAPGPNVVRVRGVDPAGNVSVPIVRNYTYVVTVPLVTQTQGDGVLKTNWTGPLLEIGKTYTVTAIPGAGQIFAGWQGVSSDSPKLRFVMQSNLTLIARFVPNPFPPVKGNYNGLVMSPNGVTPDNSGSFTVTVTASGAFSGKLRLAGKNLSFHSHFTAAGEAYVVVNRGLQSPLALTLNLDLRNGTDQVLGSVTDGGWTSAVIGDRNVFEPLSNPAPQAGQSAFVLDNADQNNAIAASGLSRIAASGRVAVQGLLGDGRKFTTASTLAKNGDCPFYLSLSQGSEVVIGWLNFPATMTPAASGTVLWVQTGTNAFSATLQASSAPQ